MPIASRSLTHTPIKQLYQLRLQLCKTRWILGYFSNENECWIASGEWYFRTYSGSSSTTPLGYPGAWIGASQRLDGRETISWVTSPNHSLTQHNHETILGWIHQSPIVPCGNASACYRYYWIQRNIGLDHRRTSHVEPITRYPLVANLTIQCTVLATA